MKTDKNKIPKFAIVIIIIAVLMLLVGLFMLGKFLTLDGGFQPKTIEVTETETIDYTIQETTEETTEEKIVKIYEIEETETNNEITLQNVNVPLDKAKQIIASDLEKELNKINFIETNNEDYEGYINWVLTFTCDGKKYNYMVSAYDGRILRRDIIG